MLSVSLRNTQFHRCVCRDAFAAGRILSHNRALRSARLPNVIELRDFQSRRRKGSVGVLLFHAHHARHYVKQLPVGARNEQVHVRTRRRRSFRGILLQNDVGLCSGQKNRRDFTELQTSLQQRNPGRRAWIALQERESSRFAGPGSTQRERPAKSSSLRPAADFAGLLRSPAMDYTLGRPRAIAGRGRPAFAALPGADCPTRLGMVTIRPRIAMRMVVTALRNPAAASTKTNSEMRNTRSSRSRHFSMYGCGTLSPFMGQSR